MDWVAAAPKFRKLRSSHQALSFRNLAAKPAQGRANARFGPNLMPPPQANLMTSILCPKDGLGRRGIKVSETQESQPALSFRNLAAKPNQNQSRSQLGPNPIQCTWPDPMRPNLNPISNDLGKVAESRRLSESQRLRSARKALSFRNLAAKPAQGRAKARFGPNLMPPPQANLMTSILCPKD